MNRRTLDATESTPDVWPVPMQIAGERVVLQCSRAISRHVSIVAIGCLGILIGSCTGQGDGSIEQRVVVASDGWEIVGDLRIPSVRAPVPAVLMLNKAAGDRSAYTSLATRLAERGVASFRVDLRAHGESTNLGVFNPEEPGGTAILEGTSHDVVAALSFLKGHAGIDSSRIGVVGASYSGEAMAEAGRQAGFAKAYVALSPGSFSTESARGIDGSGAAWLFIRSRDEPVTWVQIAVDSAMAFSRVAEAWLVPGSEHASRILPVQPGIVDRIASWLASNLENR